MIVNENGSLGNSRTLFFVVFCVCLFLFCFLNGCVHLVNMFSHHLVDMQITVWTCRANAYTHHNAIHLVYQK